MSFERAATDTSRPTKADAAQVLDRFFAVVRQEAADNPKFASRLLDALGVEVVFRGEAAAASVDPVQVALRGQEEFRKTFLTFPAKTLKAISKDFNLATPADLKGKTKPPQIVEVMWSGAQSKIQGAITESW
jgi:hypothetical protein